MCKPPETTPKQSDVEESPVPHTSPSGAERTAEPFISHQRPFNRHQQQEPVLSLFSHDMLEGQRGRGGAQRVHHVLAASLICVSGQIVWVDRRAAGTGSWHQYLGEGPETGWRNLLALDERLEKLKSHVRCWSSRK